MANCGPSSRLGTRGARVRPIPPEWPSRQSDAPLPTSPINAGTVQPFSGPCLLSKIGHCAGQRRRPLARMGKDLGEICAHFARLTTKSANLRIRDTRRKGRETRPTRLRDTFPQARSAPSRDRNDQIFYIVSEAIAQDIRHKFNDRFPKAAFFSRSRAVQPRAHAVTWATWFPREDRVHPGERHERNETVGSLTSSDANPLLG